MVSCFPVLPALFRMEHPLSLGSMWANSSHIFKPLASFPRLNLSRPSGGSTHKKVAPRLTGMEHRLTFQHSTIPATTKGSREVVNATEVAYVTAGKFIRLMNPIPAFLSTLRLHVAARQRPNNMTPFLRIRFWCTNRNENYSIAVYDNAMFQNKMPMTRGSPS